MSEDPYPFESDDDIEIRELDLDDVDSFGDERITVGELVGENESWRYGHVIVDEAQDLTPMQWRMIMRRVRGRALTIVGDLAQRSGSTAADWSELLPPELAHARRQDLTVNYRSPVEIHDLAVAVLAAFAPGVQPSAALRSTGFLPTYVRVEQIAPAVAPAVGELLDAVGGLVAVIGSDIDALESRFRSEAQPGVVDNDGPSADADALGPDDDRVQFLTPRDAKGLEFDAVVLVEPAELWDRPAGRPELYIALTRATQRLTVLHTRDLPVPFDAPG